ncbi:MAG: hypothetical protein RML36_01820 [Anaerolineae bacterium]|nr:hypothetical protein [Anaerolineae bacterium]MDW8098205.1 hypothetical protein [Anaerolineae bacterium]
MNLTWPQMMGVLSAGFLWGIAGLMALAGAQAKHSGDPKRGWRSWRPGPAWRCSSWCCSNSEGMSRWQP